MVVSNGCQQWLSAMAVSNGCQQWLSALAVSNGCQPWLSAIVFPPKTSIFAGFVQNGRLHAYRGVKPVRMVKFSGQTELISMISGTLLRRYTSVASGGELLVKTNCQVNPA